MGVADSRSRLPQLQEAGVTLASGSQQSQKHAVSNPYACSSALQERYV